jgi:hypothetical protein
VEYALFRPFNPLVTGPIPVRPTKQIKGLANIVVPLFISLVILSPL